MKLSLGLAAAFAGIAAAATPSADVYLLRSTSPATSTECPSLPRQLARIVFMQRLSKRGGIGSLSDLPASVRREDAVSYLNTFGQPPAPLMAESSTNNPTQLLVLLEGVTAENAKALGRAVPGWKPSFAVADPPSAAANQALMDEELGPVDMTRRGCEVEAMFNPLDDSCVRSGNRAVRFDAKTNPEILETLADHLPQLVKLAASGEMETTLVLLPEATRRSSLRSWSTKRTELRPRQAVEEVMSLDDDEADADPTSRTSHAGTAAAGASTIFKVGSLPACFASASSCNNATNSCSGHGECINRWEKEDGTTVGTPCFVCRCVGTRSEAGAYTHWAGPACTKIDVSTPFWLFVSFTIVMVGILSFAIGLLFQVGEEQLPGVIGAGVSKSK